MLRLKNIRKDYIVGDTIVHALRGVSIELRKMNSLPCSVLRAVERRRF